MKPCCYCQKLFEDYDLRPYAEGGKETCHPCATATPERRAEVERRFDAAMRAVEDRGETPALTATGVKGIMLSKGEN